MATVPLPTEAPALGHGQSLRLTKDVNARAHAERLAHSMYETIHTAQDVRAKLSVVLDGVFHDKEIQDNFPGAAIRYAAMCGEVAREIMLIIGEDPKTVGLLSIGDVILPPFADAVVKEMLEASHAHHMKLTDEETTGYDLSSRGSLSARSAMIKFFEHWYGFHKIEGLSEEMAQNAAIVGGGMRGLDDLATAHVDISRKAKQRPRFIQPDNSFGTWHRIVEMRSVDGVVADVDTLKTTRGNLLHLTGEQVDAFYDNNERTDTNDMWCITPVGNPSGTRVRPDQLLQTCERIISHRPNATILLDCTYVRMLSPEQGHELMAGLLSNPHILQRTMFLESFSKTHGLCGERVGAYFSANKELFDAYHVTNMTLSAGNGRQKSALVLAIAGADDRQRGVIEDLHNFWQKERQGLHAYLIDSHNFDDLFDEDQAHIADDQLEDPTNLYLFVKLRDGVTSKHVLIRTGCLGVITKMGDETYMRFAVGKITEPTYAKYAPEIS